ncbi:sugar ABC transporter ATP-binding protein [Ferviditalea candida]|uniref:Sugar ABC transporter ATP-binding protein n=1 Tax=Ferviditalea candida TaxID=3108399 RepID=A0ABU5ZG80_9BACL|nr:sugar ABC transporter ATP-binding protein [Paenibacillaceae bacterium T2]
MKPFLQMLHISKTFPGVKALKNVNLEIFQGEVLALAGENGAGKSTLMKILTGVYEPDQDGQGKILINGEEVQIKDPIHARQLGISIIYQELTTAQNLTVAENIFLAKEPRLKLGFIDRKKMFEDSKKILKDLNMNIDPSTYVSELSIGQQQMIEIAKAISYDSKVIVMDEPTASLSHQETRTLMEMVKELRRQNIAIVYISHRLEEIFEISDRITVLRDGETVATMNTAEVTTELLVKKMVDRDLSEIYSKSESYATDEVILDVKNLTQVKKRSAHKAYIENISFKLHRGEILGFSGLVGAGRTEIMELLFGMHPQQGEIYLDGESVKIKTPSDAIEKGIGFVTEDRKQLGLVLNMTVRENFSLTHLDKFARFDFVNRKDETKETQQYIETLGIKTPSTEQQVVNLSGGNQQKVVIAKWVARNPKVLIVDEPTRGIDIGAKAEVHALLIRLARQGMGIIMISSDLPEVLAMSDRIMVIREGKITGEFTRQEADQERIIQAATGQKSHAAV